MKRLTKKLENGFYECIDEIMTFEGGIRQTQIIGHMEDIEEKHHMSIDEMDAYITEHEKIEQRCEIIDTKIEKYEEGETVLYRNGSRFELGIVKRVCGDDEYFVNYHTGDTAARTHARHLHKVANAYAFHVIRLDPDDNERR